jgi:hypothetical protein
VALWFLFSICSHLESTPALPLGLLFALSIHWCFAFRIDVKPPTKTLIGIWVLTRSISCLGTPFFEDDHHRYIWDGWVTLHGGNALIIAPQEVHNPIDPLITEERARKIEWRKQLLEPHLLADLLNKINYPESPSIYGPSGQIFLAITQLPPYLLDRLGFHLNLSHHRFSLQLFLILCDGWLCWLMLKNVGLKPAFLLVTCPLLLKEVSNSLHLDIVPTLCLFLSLLMGRTKKSFLSACCFVFAVCIKPFAIFLWPWFLRVFPHRKTWALTSLFLSLLVWSAYLMDGGMETLTGTRYFSSLWSMNDFFTALIREVLYHTTSPTWSSLELPPMGTIHVSQAQQLSRLLGLSLFCGLWLFAWIKNRNIQHDALFSISAWTLLGIWWFSPVQNPWYLLWGLPFFISSQHRIGLFYCLLFPFYYFNFLFTATSHLLHPFQWWVVLPHLATITISITIWTASKKTTSKLDFLSTSFK